jgi:hypothetical protein
MSQATLYGTMGLVTVAMCWAFAVVLYRVGVPGSVARKLAVLLLVEGFTLIFAGYVDLLFAPAMFESSWYPQWAQGTFILHTIGDCAMLAFYPPFLAAALQTKLTRPFASGRAQSILGIVSVMFVFAVVLSPLEIGATLLYVMLSTLFAYALIAAIHAWYVAERGVARTRAGIFAIAFGFRDVCWGFIYIYGITQIATGTYQDESAVAPDFFNVVYAGGTFLAIPLIAYGILRAHLFDIDLRLRWTIKQSTLAAAIVAIIFALSEGADRFLSSELGDGIGLFAAALVVFFLAPLQRFAERVAAVAMPNTNNTPEYAAFRKMQVYEAAVVEARLEEGISQKERALLVRLRDSLGISASDAQAIELELQPQPAKPG